MLSFLWWASFVAILGLISLGGYYLFLEMVKANSMFTQVESGWKRIVLRWGKYDRELEPGFRFIGIPGIHTLYKRTMTFFKTVPKGKGVEVEPHEDKDIMAFKIVSYPHTVPFNTH